MGVMGGFCVAGPGLKMTFILIGGVCGWGYCLGFLAFFCGTLSGTHGAWYPFGYPCLPSGGVVPLRVLGTPSGTVPLRVTRSNSMFKHQCYNIEYQVGTLSGMVPFRVPCLAKEFSVLHATKFSRRKAKKGRLTPFQCSNIKKFLPYFCIYKNLILNEL